MHNSAFLLCGTSMILSSRYRRLLLGWPDVLVSARPEFSVFVGDLASEVDDFQLLQVFKKFPSCKAAKVVTDQYGYSRYVSCSRRTRPWKYCLSAQSSAVSPIAFMLQCVVCKFFSEHEFQSFLKECDFSLSRQQCWMLTTNVFYFWTEGWTNVFSVLC